MDTSATPAAIASAINRWMEKFMPVLTPLGIVLGFLLPGVFIHLRPFVPFIFAVMTLSGALKLRVRDLGMAIAAPLPIILFFIFAHVLMPTMVCLFGGLVFRQNPDVVAGYVLLFSVPTAVSGFIWIAIYGGDIALSLAIILLDTLAAPLVVPLTVSILLNTSVALDMSGMTISLLLMVVLPTIIGVFLNEVSRGKLPPVVSPYLGPLAKLCLVLVICANAAAAPPLNLRDPQVWLIAALCVVFTLAGFTGSKLIGMAVKLGPEKKTALFFTAGLRNISAAATMAIDFFPPGAALPAILGIVFQQTMAALMGKIFIPPVKNPPSAPEKPESPEG